MRLPRDISGDELIKLLGKYGYKKTRQTGSHIRLTSSFKGTDHHVTIPHHKPLKIGTLKNILNEVALYLKMDLNTLLQELFR